MDAQELTLNIAVNLGRLGRWAGEGNKKRVEQFLEETANYLSELKKTRRSPRFEPTLQKFEQSFRRLSANTHLDEEWAEDMFTWANILTHRAKFNDPKEQLDKIGPVV